MKSYNSLQKQWERHSAIRTRPRRVVEEIEEGVYFYPITKQPLMVHQLIHNLPERQKRYILAQSLFKYMNDIANIEKDIINKAAYGITKDYYGVVFSSEIKRDALTIVIDETYHAYVAIDFMNQVAEIEQVQVLNLPRETELSIAIKSLSADLSNQTKKKFELIAVAIAEHALTSDLVDIGKAKGVSKMFYCIMHDHLLDENRHAKYFEHILAVFWHSLDDNDKATIAPLIPKLINQYLAEDLQKDFDRQILLEIGLPQSKANLVVEESYNSWKSDSINQKNIVAKHMLALLQRTNIANNEIIKNEFAGYGVNF